MEALHTLTITLTDDELERFQARFGHLENFDPADLLRAFLETLWAATT